MVRILLVEGEKQRVRGEFTSTALNILLEDLTTLPEPDVADCLCEREQN